MAEIDGKERERNVIFDETAKKDSLRTVDHEIEELEVKIAQTENEMRNCISKKKYIEAEKLKENIEQMKLDFKNKKRILVQLQHKKANQIFEEAQSSEFEEFNAYWENRYKEFDEQVGVLEEE